MIAALTECLLYLHNRNSRGEGKNYVVLCAIYLVRTPDQCDGINRLFSARGRALFNGCHYIWVAIPTDYILQRLGQLYDHTFCLPVISSGVFRRNWAMCKKVQVEPKIFLKHRWIHFLGFLLIPRYNHDRIIREFRRPRRRTGILCFGTEGYALIAVRR